MNENEFLTFFSNLFESSTEDINMDTEFRYLDEWSSMIGLCFITDMREKYSIIISPQEIKNAETIGDLYQLYIEK